MSRPRRFDKSVDADMLVAFFSRGCDSRAQFEGLDVSKDPAFEPIFWGLSAFTPSTRTVAGAIAERQHSSFWTSTETFEALRVYLDMDFDGVGTELVTMLDGQHVPANVGTFENDMRTFHSKDDVYALLCHLGYLAYGQVGSKVFIPNKEICREFANAIQVGVAMPTWRTSPSQAARFRP